MAKNQLLSELKKDVANKFKGKKIIPGKGRVSTGLVLISEKVNKEEETRNKLFSDESGKLLAKMLREQGLKNSDFYITPAVKFRPKNDSPSPKEIKQSSFFLKQEIKILEPKMIIALGAIALRGLGVKLPLNNIRGRMIRFGEMNLFATHSPSSVNTDPQLQTELKSDLKKLRDVIKDMKDGK